MKPLTRLMPLSSFVLAMALLGACAAPPRPPATAVPSKPTALPATATAAPTSAPIEPTPVPPTAAPTAQATVAATAITPTAALTNALSLDIVDTLMQSGRFKTLESALQSAGLTETLKGAGPFTVLAPTDEAFAKIDKAVFEGLMKPENKAELLKVLNNHVLPGSVKVADVIKLKGAKTVEGSEPVIQMNGNTITVNGLKLIETDIATKNGIIHVVDGVAIPNSVDVKKLTVVVGEKDVVDTAIATGNFKTFEAMLHAAGLVDTLKGKGPFTVLAPTDAAFAKLDKKILDDLLKPANKKELVRLLDYHLLNGKMLEADIAKAPSAKTLEGDALIVKASGAQVMVNDAKITQADLPATNGVIHAIDTVLTLPKAK